MKYLQNARYGQSPSIELLKFPAPLAATAQPCGKSMGSDVPGVSRAIASSGTWISICDRLRLSLRSGDQVSARTSANWRASAYSRDSYCVSARTRLLIPSARKLANSESHSCWPKPASC